MSSDVLAPHVTSHKIITAVAEAKGCTSSELTPLYENIDPDTLDALFAGSETSRTPPRKLVFTYDGYEIELTADQTIALSPHEA